MQGPVPVVPIHDMCAQPLYVHLVDASVQVYTSETLPVFIIGTSTFFPIVESGLLGELLLLNSDSLAGTLESLMLQAWQGSSKRVSYGCQNPIPLLPLAAD